ncbi:hypothetical protein KCU78_g52, partial [Aureobasidium melanogenum]
MSLQMLATLSPTEKFETEEPMAVTMPEDSWPSCRSLPQRPNTGQLVILPVDTTCSVRGVLSPVTGQSGLTMRRSFAPCKTLACTCVDDMVVTGELYKDKRRLHTTRQDIDEKEEKTQRHAINT